jgi:hypothetical protein
MEVNGGLHVAAVFIPEAEKPVRIIQAAGWSFEAVCKPWKRKKILP